MSTRDGRRLLVAAIAATGLAAVLVVLAAGPISFQDPRWMPEPVQPAFTPAPAPSMQGLPPYAPGTQTAADVVRIILIVLLALAVATAVAALAVYIARRIAGRRRWVRRGSASRRGAAGAAAVDDVAVSAPVVRRGIARALDVLAEPRPPADAVVQAWLGLEEAAALSGASRRVAETPAEHVTRIIGRFAADRHAADMLLRLYQDVRFGARAADAVTVDAARECLLLLQASWRDEGADGAAGDGPRADGGPSDGVSVPGGGDDHV